MSIVTSYTTQLPQKGINTVWVGVLIPREREREKKGERGERAREREGERAGEREKERERENRDREGVARPLGHCGYR